MGGADDERGGGFEEARPRRARFTPARKSTDWQASPAAPAVVDGDPPAPPEVSGGSASRPIEFATSPVVRALFVLVPATVAAILLIFRFFPRDPMYASGLGAVVVGFAIFIGFGRRVPDAFALVRQRRLASDSDVAAYREFERETGRLLNARPSLIAGLLFAGAALARYPVGVGGLGALIEAGPRGAPMWGPLAVADLVAEAVLGFAVGLAMWRMGVVGWRIHRLGERFSLRLQLGHPDGCGGFKPLGNVCLWNALILAVPGAFLGWWIAVGPVSQYGSRYVVLHSVLAAIVVLVATVAFLAPLWSIHRAMTRSAEAVRGHLEQHGRRIDELARELVERGDQLSAGQRESRSNDLKFWRELYERHRHVPTWPIDLPLVTKFVGSQAVPLLGLTGMSQPIVDIVERLLSWTAEGA